MPIITLTTDFGVAGRYVAQMKGALLSRAPGATLVDISHEVPPQDIAAGARLAEQAASWFPAGTIHLVVVDPGVGTDRPIVAAASGGQRFIGPDNGLLGWITDQPGWRAVTVDPTRLGSPTPSATFHGRDLMAPAAAKLALGAEIDELGDPREALERAATPSPHVGEHTIDGCVVEVDRYGNLITNVRPGTLGDAPLDDTLRVAIGGHETFGLWRTYGDQPDQTLMALVGSDGFVELAIVNGDAARMLGAGVGDAVRFEWRMT